MTPFHPTIVSDKLVDTVNFYEDFFGFVPLIEQDGYVLLQQKDNPDICIAIFDKNHRCVAEKVDAVQGLILNMPVKSVRHAYDHLYMEGLTMFKELGEDIHGKKHFVVTDPNGVLVNVSEPMTLEAVAAA